MWVEEEEEMRATTRPTTLYAYYCVLFSIRYQQFEKTVNERSFLNGFSIDSRMEPPLGDKGHRLQSPVNRNIPQISQMYREHLSNLLKDLGRFMIVVLCVFDGFQQGKIVRQ